MGWRLLVQHFLTAEPNTSKYVLNVGVPKGYSDIALHMDPMELITTSAAKLGITEDYLAMVTAANVHNFSLVTKKTTTTP